MPIFMFQQENSLRYRGQDFSQQPASQRIFELLM